MAKCNTMLCDRDAVPPFALCGPCRQEGLAAVAAAGARRLEDLELAKVIDGARGELAASVDRLKADNRYAIRLLRHLVELFDGPPDRVHRTFNPEHCFDCRAAGAIVGKEPHPR